MFGGLYRTSVVEGQKRLHHGMFIIDLSDERKRLEVSLWHNAKQGCNLLKISAFEHRDLNPRP